MVTVWRGVREPPPQCPQQTIDFVDASADLRQLSRRPGIVRPELLIVVSGHAVRELL
jgi:hypothetical protein